MSVPKLTEIFLIKEDSVGNIVNLLKMDPSIAREFQRMFGKFAFTMASIRMADEKRDPDWSLEYWLEATFGVASDLMRLLKAHPDQEKSVRGLTSDKAKALLVGHAASKVDFSGRSELDFPDGFFWVKLNSETERGLEGGQMQHCGNDDRGDLYSLRDSSRNPHVTLTMDSNRQVHQITGKQNKAPDRKYWSYIKKFFEKFNAELSPKASAEDQRLIRTGLTDYLK